MKKIYTTPQIIVTKVETQTLMAGSVTGGSVYDTDADSGAAGFSRDGGFWDDEDE